jgi:NADH:ubiquinone oxidoreductase subunit
MKSIGFGTGAATLHLGTAMASRHAAAMQALLDAAGSVATGEPAKNGGLPPEKILLRGSCRRGASMKNLLVKVFTWWNGATIGTQVWTWLYGELVGEDEFGNRYYRTRHGKIDPSLGFERRWVVYLGLAEASMVPPSWHAWLHHTVDVPPTQEKIEPRSWWKPHRPNLTGTPGAARPSGSTLAQGRRPRATGDYSPWRPE